MTDVPDIKSPQDKAKTFIDELNELQVKYNVRIGAIINFTPSGIFPSLQVLEAKPKAENGESGKEPIGAN